MHTRTSTTLLASVLLGIILPVAAYAQRSAFEYAGTWEGTYTAAQGITRVVLVIEPVDDSKITGHYIFFPDNSNPDVPSGHYTIEGKVDSTTGALSFSGKKWIIQPPHYAFAGFNGSLSDDHKKFAGKVSVVSQGVIGKFSVERLSTCYPQAGPGASTGGR